MEDENRLDKPIEATVPGYGVLRFGTLTEVRRWAQREFDAFTITDPEISGVIRGGVERYQELYGEIVATATPQKKLSSDERVNIASRVFGQLQRIAERKFETSRTVVGKAVIDIKDRLPVVAAAVLLLRSDAPVQINRNTDIRLILGALEYVIRLELADEPANELRKAGLEEAIEDYSRRFADHVSVMSDNVSEGEKYVAKLATLYEDEVGRHETLAKQHRDRMDQILEEFERDKEALKVAFNEELILRSAATYWSDKAREHQKAFRVSAGFFFLAAVLGIGAIVWFDKTLIEHIEKIGDAVFLGGLVAITFPVLLYFWLMRMLSRFVLNNMRREDDSKERHTMINTYLALLASTQSPIVDQERIILLNAIFRQGPGDAHDEGETSLLAELLRTQRGTAGG